MGKLSRSVRKKTMPVDTGAGRTRIETATPLCRPIPLAWTGRWIVVSKRTEALLAGQRISHELWLIAISQPNRNIMIIKDTLKLADAKKPHIAVPTVAQVPLFMSRDI